VAVGPFDPYVEDDGLATPEVGGWAIDKYRLLALYAELFSTGMKNKWGRRVYVDLYAGAGHSRIYGTNRFLKGSPLIALTVPHAFDKYIFCEERPDLLAALRSRVERLRPDADATFNSGNCDSEVEQIVAQIPAGGAGRTVLSLCVVDPFDFGVRFETLRRLSSVYIDFVVLLAIGMDANRNYDHYVDGDSPKIDKALGNSQWRDRWRAAGAQRSDFRRFLAEEFSRSMATLGYLKTPVDRMKLVRSVEKNLPLYYIALFSRSNTAFRFWDQVLEYGTDQRSLFN
jgi:three-Cys-motif partner protein